MLSDLDILAILTQSKDATAVYDTPNLRIRFVNDTMLEVWGKDRSVTGKTLEEALPELEGQPFADLMKKVWETGKTYQATDMPATLVVDGHFKTSYFDFEYRPIFNKDGTTRAILHTSTDVSSRVLAWRRVEEKQQRELQLIEELSETNKNIQEANDGLSAANRDLVIFNDNINQLNLRLQESETDFRRMVEQAPVAILVFRGDDMVIDITNEPMLEILNKDAGIIGQPLLKGLPELKGQAAVELLFEVFKTGKTFEGNEVPVRIMRGRQLETRYFNFSYKPLRDGLRIIGVMDIAVEVTTQVLARKSLEAIITEKTVLERTLRANEQRLQAVLDTMAEGVVIVDKNYNPTYANQMAQRIFGLSEAKFLGRKYGDKKWQNERLDGSPLPLEEHPMAIVFRTGIPVYDREIGVDIPGHEKIFISINAAPLKDGNEEVEKCIVTFANVTGRRKMMQEKDDFISVASHELRTPTAALKAALQLMDRLLPDIKPDMLDKLVKQSNKSLNKLSDLINSLLNSSRISEGRFPIHKKVFKVANLINDCCQHIRAAGTHHIVLKGDIDLELYGDEQLLDQVVVNFVNNAVKYAPKSNEIIIVVERMDAWAKISVTDFGPGISPEKISHIFERYYRVDYENIQFTGFGLGLYICAEIIQKHGGAIGADSKVGQGSTFWFTLPLAKGDQS
jgi:PAS domain S-box-containing protein